VYLLFIEFQVQHTMFNNFTNGIRYHTEMFYIILLMLFSSRQSQLIISQSNHWLAFGNV